MKVEKDDECTSYVSQYEGGKSTLFSFFQNTEPPLSRENSNPLKFMKFKSSAECA